MMDWTGIILGILTLLGGCGWLIDRKKHRQEIESLKADNRQKDMNLSKDYVTEWRTYIAEPLTVVDLCRDSAKLMRAWLCARCSIGYQREVGELRTEVAALRHAIQKIDACAHRDNCPVINELQHHAKPKI